MNQFQGWGTSLAWWANVDYPDNIKHKLVDLLFSKTGLSLNIVRYNLGATNTNQIKQKSPRFLPCIKNGKDESFNLNNDKRQLSILNLAVKAGVNHVEIFANSPPWWMTKNNNTSGADTVFTTNLHSDYLNDYVNFLIKSFYILKEDYPITSLEPFNEPSNPFWTSNNGQEGCYFDYNTRNKIIKLIKSKDPTIPLTTADSFSVGFALPWHLYCNNSFLSDKINIHGYGLTWRGYRLYLDDLNIIRYLFRWITKKSIWMSEFGMGGPNNIDTGLNFAKQIFRDLNTLKPEAWIYWQVIEDVSENGWGLIQVPFNNPTYIKIQKQYWIMMHFTKTLSEGDNYTFIDNTTLKITNKKGKLAYIILQRHDFGQFKNLQITNIRITDHLSDYKQLTQLPENTNKNFIISFFVENNK